MKLNRIFTITGKIVLESGLHIGAGDTEMHIGGTDNPVVKHPHTNEPYIPGSSIKGKVRALLEMKSGLMVHTKGKPVTASDLDRKLNKQEREEAEMILKLFGSSGAAKEAISKIGPSRLSFGDCSLSEESRDRTRDANLPYTEVKSENSINRINGTAENPRFTERVVAGLSFDFSITVKEMDGDTGLVEYLLTGLKMLSMDALGGSGSRGYGRVRFEFDDAEIQKTFDAAMA
ncbi:type III-A CRISPR-associated RAMP protein Csm3 [Desulfolithobacter sp.]